ncbi:MAG: hypothetical protein P4L31_02615, partial [Candidatus Babeliales bacterium]|nr:hypothetical protein [Candidatus Babeliales bacterium]
MSNTTDFIQATGNQASNAMNTTQLINSTRLSTDQWIKELIASYKTQGNEYYLSVRESFSADFIKPAEASFNAFYKFGHSVITKVGVVLSSMTETTIQFIKDIPANLLW